MKQVTKNMILQARQTNLVAFLQSQGIELKKIGANWTMQEHDSLRIKDNMFCWYSKEKQGNSIDFCMLYFGWDFQASVEKLTQVNVTIVPKIVPSVTQPKEITYAQDRKRVIAYLCKTRKLDYQTVVAPLMTQGLIAQDNKNNCVFKIFNENKEIVGVELCGTLSNVRFKQATQQTGYGFNITIGEPEKILFFESAIDLLSFYQLNYDKIHRNHLVSMGGLREEIIQQTLSRFHIEPSQAFLCVDRDRAGVDFTRAIQSKLKGIHAYQPPKPFKDWNEYLITSMPLIST